MANVNFNRRLFEKEIGKLDDNMQHLIAMFGTPLEEVRADEVEIEIFPNRPDLLSYSGFKRSFLAFLGKKTGLREYKIKKPEKNYKVYVDSSLDGIRPYTACAIVKKLNFDDNKIKEIIDLQEKLHNTVGRKRKKVAIGIYPLEEIKLPITFKAVEPDKIRFVPLESSREMSGLEILQKHPTGKEYAHLLAGKTKFPVFYDDNGSVLSMPPIINSDKTGRITNKTKEVFIECSGNDFEILKKCLNIIITTLSDMDAQVYQMEIRKKGVEITPDLSSEKMNISLENTNKLLGLDLNEKQIKNFLERMGHNYNKGEVEVAAWRTDMLHEVDLIEDIGIAYGFDKYEPEVPELATVGGINYKESLKKKIADILVGLGFLEISSLHLTTKDNQFKKMGYSEKDFGNFTEVLDSKTENTVLRKDLSHFIMKVFSENVDSEYPQKIFELGSVFDLDRGNIVEKERFSLGITPGNFTDCKQVLEYLGKMLDIKFEFEEASKIFNYSIEGRTASLEFNGKTVGFIGEIHPKILKNWRIRTPVVLMEIELEDIFEKLK